jgi:hypothetical protein
MPIFPNVVVYVMVWLEILLSLAWRISRANCLGFDVSLLVGRGVIRRMSGVRLPFGGLRRTETHYLFECLTICAPNPPYDPNTQHNPVTPNELLLPPQKRYRPVVAQQDLSDEEIAMDWTLSKADRVEISQYRKNSRLFIAIQLCTVRLYGRFVAEANNLSPRIVRYLNTQVDLTPP